MGCSKLRRAALYHDLLNWKVCGLIILCCAYFCAFCAFLRLYQYSISQFLRVHLGRQAVTILFEYKIHTPFGELRFFIIAATALLFLIFGSTDRHPFPSAKINCCVRHYLFLSVIKIRSISSNPGEPFWICCSTRDRFSLKLPVTVSSHFLRQFRNCLCFLLSVKFEIP